MFKLHQLHPEILELIKIFADVLAMIGSREIDKIFQYLTPLLLDRALEFGPNLGPKIIGYPINRSLNMEFGLGGY